MSQERDVIPLILTGLGTIAVTVLTLWYYGYVHFAKEEDALLLADFTMLKSMLFGGEGILLATLKGTGTVWIQSLPFSRLAERIYDATVKAREEVRAGGQ